MLRHIKSQVFSLSSGRNGGYDLPLHARLGTEFLVLLLALMTYLSLLSTAGNLALGHMTARWTSGLENSLTIEIPAGKDTKEQGKKLLAALDKTAGVKSSHILSDADMQEILSPWLGDNTPILSDIPLPTLISVELNERTDIAIRTIRDMTHGISPDATVDAHEGWLKDLVKLTDGLRLTALGIFILIMIVTAFVVSGAVSSRMAIHQRELELLHIMGASDQYITQQFVRYVFWQSGKGLFAGIVAGILTLIIFVSMGRHSDGTIPAINLTGLDWLVFIVVPLLLLLIGILSAYRTSFRVLREMP